MWSKHSRQMSLTRSKRRQGRNRYSRSPAPAPKAKAAAKQPKPWPGFPVDIPVPTQFYNGGTGKSPGRVNRTLCAPISPAQVIPRITRQAGHGSVRHTASTVAFGARSTTRTVRFSPTVMVNVFPPLNGKH